MLLTKMNEVFLYILKYFTLSRINELHKQKDTQKLKQRLQSND